MTKIEMLEKLLIDNPTRVFTTKEIGQLLKSSKPTEIINRCDVAARAGYGLYKLAI